MDRRRIKFVTLILGVALSMTFLLVVAMNRSGTMLYYLSVTEFRQQTDPYDTDFRINGTVVTGSIERLPTGIDVRFTMTDGEAELPVSYNGVVPDTFVDNAAVVVEGRLGADGTFVAHELLAKCPSKYEAAEGDSGGSAEY